MENQTSALDSIAEAREIIESIGETCPAYVGFEKPEYTVSGSQLQAIARALYLADVELFEHLKNEKPL